MTDIIQLEDILTYRLVKFRKRLVFDILHQREDTIFKGSDDDNYFMFIASNGYQVISRSRMDIQTERLWLFGCNNDSHADRSGTMVFSTQETCDKAYPNFHLALKEWFLKIKSGEPMTKLSDFKPKPPIVWKVKIDNNKPIFIEDEKELNKIKETYLNKNISILPLYE